jgi:hypothetical protein
VNNDLTKRIWAALDEAQRNWNHVHDDRCDWLRTRGQSLCNCVWGGKDGRMLALIAADRRVLARHHLVTVSYGEDADVMCNGCGQITDGEPCADLRDLVARWGVTP